MYDAIVCGSGVQGLWTSNHLVKQSRNVLLLDQFPFPHNRGSSHGPSRITRCSYTTVHHAKMMPDAFSMWKQLEISQKSNLFIKCGLLSVFSQEEAAVLASSLTDIQRTFEKLTSKQIVEKYPGLANIDGLLGIYENEAGVLKSNKCLAALMKNFLELGGVMHDEEQVQHIFYINDDLVEIHTNKAIYQSKSVVLTCGPWTNKLLKPLNLQLPLQPYRVSVEYWKATRPDLYDIKNFPTLMIHGIGLELYSTPIMEYPDLLKVCSHESVEVDPDERNIYDHEKTEAKMERLSSVISKHFPFLVPKCALQEICVYTKTPDRDFVIDRHPVHKNIIIGAGFSGHGFKISPVVGKILADMALNKTIEYEVKHFSIDRFSAKSVL